MGPGSGTHSLSLSPGLWGEHEDTQHHPFKGQSPPEPRNPREEGNGGSRSLPAVCGHPGWRQTRPRAEVGWEGDITGPGAEGREINSGKEREMV